MPGPKLSPRKIQATSSFAKFEALIWLSGDDRVCAASPPRYRHSPFWPPVCSVEPSDGTTRIAARTRTPQSFIMLPPATGQYGRELDCAFNDRSTRVDSGGRQRSWQAHSRDRRSIKQLDLE